MNREKDAIQIGDDVIISVVGRVVDVHYKANGTVDFLSIEAPNGARKLFFPQHFRDMTISALPDEDFKARWSA